MLVCHCLAEMLALVDETITAFPRVWSKADDGVSAGLNEDDHLKPEPGKHRLASYPSNSFQRVRHYRASLSGFLQSWVHALHKVVWVRSTPVRGMLRGKCYDLLLYYCIVLKLCQTIVKCGPSVLYHAPPACHRSQLRCWWHAVPF